VTASDVELIIDHCRTVQEAHARRYPGYRLDTERERETIIALHNAIVGALARERVQGYAA
jgi:hypothetical protein